MGSFIASRTIVAQRLLYCRYDRPATRQYADAAAVEDMVLDDRDCPSATDALQSNQHACEKSRPVNKTNNRVDDIISCSGSQHKLVGRSQRSERDAAARGYEGSHTTSSSRTLGRLIGTR